MSSWARLKRNGFTVLPALLILVVFSCTSLIIVNYYTIKTLSAFRAFINGESQYSKAQKDGSRHLLLYLNQRNEEFYTAYTRDIDINAGDSLALKGLFAGHDRSLLIVDFVRGRNDVADADDMIWLVRNFSRVNYMKRCIQLWGKADNLVRIMHETAMSARKKIKRGTYTAEQATADSQIINNWDNSLTLDESGFSDTLDEASRKIKTFLLITDFTMVLLIVGCTGAYSAISIRRLISAGNALEAKNEYLIATNIELDRFVYSASHDLRAPITSLKGLLEIIREEKDPLEINTYLDYMDQSLNQQDDFIKEIINYSRNKRTDLSVDYIDLRRIVDATIHQHLYMTRLARIEFISELQAEEVYSDSLRIKIILNNLVSNAIKFSDDQKAHQTITIRSLILQNELRLEVEDNGIGIPPAIKDKIFDMFYVTLHARRGSGLGLYIAKETILKLGGRLELDSEQGRGSCFRVIIPLDLKQT